MTEWRETLSHLIAQHGPIVLFFGLLVEFIGIPFPGEISLTFAGVIVSQGILPFWPVFLASVAGTFLGSMGAYHLGKHYGNQILYRYGRLIRLTPERIAKVEGWFARYEGWMILTSRYIAGFRHLTPYITGMVKMEYWKAALFNLVGSVIWVLSFMGVGYFAGENYPVVFRIIKKNMLLAVLIAALIAWIGWWLRKRRTPKEY